MLRCLQWKIHLKTGFELALARPEPLEWGLAEAEPVLDPLTAKPVN